MRHALGAMLSITWMAGLLVWLVLLLHTIFARTEPRRSAMTQGERLLLIVSLILLGAIAGIAILSRGA